jgi:hypothetical protein
VLCGALFVRSSFHRACFIIILARSLFLPLILSPFFFYYYLYYVVVAAAVKEIPSAKSIVTIVLPQLTDDLKKDILERIASKSLMELHVAVAPAVSYE